MYSSSTTEYPKQILISEVVSDSDVNDFHSDSNELPSFCADGLVLAASSHVIVVCHINIENKFFFKRDESFWLN